MLTKKKKLSKKQIKEDKLVTTYYQAQKFYEEYQSKLLIIGGAIAVIIIAVIWYNSKMTQENLAATAELARVLPIFNDGFYQEAIDGRPGTNVIGLRKTVDEYGGSEQGEVARLYLANAYYFIGDFKQAMEEYDDYSGSNKELVAAALAGKAACFEAQNNFAEAGEFYERAAKVLDYNPLNPEYLLKAGICFIKNNNKEDAAKLFNKIKTEYKDSQLNNEVDRYFALVE